MVTSRSCGGGRGQRQLAGLPKRARIVLLASEGVANTRIAELADASVVTVLKWRARYEHAGIAGLDDADRSGRPRELDHAEIVSATLTPPPKKYGVTHWSSRLLSSYLKVGNATIARAWRENATLAGDLWAGRRPNDLTLLSFVTIRHIFDDFSEVAVNLPSGKW